MVIADRWKPLTGNYLKSTNNIYNIQMSHFPLYKYNKKLPEL